MITFLALAMRSRKVGIASASLPCSVLTQSARDAPATRKREVSDSPARSRSPEIAQEWFEGEQSQAPRLAEQIPCPSWVILPPIHSALASAEIRPATTLVLPTVRE